MSKTKREYRTYSKENYNRFIKENNITEDVLSYAKYCKNLEVCNWMFIEYALRTGEKISFPHGFGPVAVNKKMLKRYVEHDGKKYINLRVDWQKTKKLNKRVFHTNEHSDGFNYKWTWFPKESKFFQSELYVFKPCRYASRAIARYVKKPNSHFKEMYYEWTKR